MFLTHLPLHIFRLQLLPVRNLVNKVNFIKLTSKMAKRATKKKYDMPDPLPQGEVLEDAAKKQWKLGSSIGKGGFGEIYSAQEVGSSGYKYVVKIVSMLSSFVLKVFS